jgi:FeS assembly SUF system protein
MIPDTPPAAGTPKPAKPWLPIQPDPLKTLELKPHVTETLATIFDPEIPVNIYELGLIYDVIADADGHVEVRMTLTAPACPAAQTLPVEVDRKVRAVDGVTDVNVEIVWEPPWDKDKMSDVAKMTLGIF